MERVGKQKVNQKDKEVKWEWELDENKALINKKGINNLLALARSMIDKNTNLSEYKRKEILKIMRHIHSTIRKNMVRNWDEYDIQDNTVATEVTEIITNPIWSAYNRALGGEEKRLVSENKIIKELRKGNEKEEKRGSMIPGLGGD